MGGGGLEQWFLRPHKLCQKSTKKPWNIRKLNFEVINIYYLHLSLYIIELTTINAIVEKKSSRASKISSIYSLQFEELNSYVKTI